MADDPPPFSETVLRPERALPDEPLAHDPLAPGEKALSGAALHTPAAISSRPGEVYDAKWINTPGIIKGDRGPAPAHKNEFANLLCTHNQRLPDIKMLKQAFDAKMRADPAFRGDIAKLYHDARNQNHTGPGGGSPNALMVQLGLSQGTPFPRRNGDRRAYDPWDGWWSGVFDSVGTKYLNYHVWDPTVKVRSDPGKCSNTASGEPALGYDQYVQMVTQIAKPNPPPAAAAQDVSFWYAGANFMRNGLHPLNKTDFAINVWSAQDGLTGYVLKRQSGVQHLFLFAYLMDDDTLLWVAFVEDGARLTAANGNSGTLFVYAEYGQKTGGANRIYTIRGAVGAVTYQTRQGQPPQFSLSALSQVSGHRGDYKIAAKLHHPQSPFKPGSPAKPKAKP